MDEAQQAWRLWRLLQEFSDTLWTQYESALLDFCSEEYESNVVRRPTSEDTDFPF